jgi:phenylacetate-CoA ligase
MPESAGPIERLLNTSSVVARAVVERSLPFWSAGWIEGLQRRRLRAMVQHAYRTVPFYRRAMDERGLSPRDLRDAADLARLPLLGSAEVRRDSVPFLSTAYERDSLYALQSSGSSALVRKLVYWDAASIVKNLAHTARDRAVLDRLAAGGAGSRHLYILPPDGASLRIRAWWDALTIPSPRRAERHDLAPDQPYEAAVERLRAIRPRVVFSFGSYADLFFRFVRNHGLDIPVPRVWVYGGDGLSPAGRELMETIYGTTAYSTYQAVETGRLGFQCERRDGFHLNVDLCAVRLVDVHGRPVPPGEEGEVVISNLYNRAMVLLNYRLGDRAALRRDPCPCGRSLPVLAYLAGRTTDIIRLDGDRETSSLVLQNLFRRELEQAFQVQIVQAKPAQITWRVVPFSGADRAVLQRGLVARGREVLGADVEVRVEFVDHMPTTPGGKVVTVRPLPREDHA